MARSSPLMVLALVGALLACSLPMTADQPADSAVATHVAATLTALADTPDTAPAQVAGPTPSPSPSPAPDVQTQESSSGDGLTVVYLEDGNPWLLPTGEEPRQLSRAGGAFDILISDDGQRVVFLRRESGSDEPQPAEIRAVNRDGTGETTLLGPTDFDSLYPLNGMLHNDVSSIGFLPDSHRLLLNTRAVATGPGLLNYDDLWILDADSGSLSRLFEPGDGGDFVVAPNGQRLAIIRPDSLSLADADGGNLRANVLTHEPVLTYSEYLYYAQPIWSADSTELAVAIPGRDPLADGTGALWRIPAAGGPAAQVATYRGDFFFTQQFGGPLISPDFQTVAILRERDRVDELLLAPFDGGEPTIYDSGSILWHGWVPGGTGWVYSKGGPQQLWLGRHGQEPTSLVTGSDLTWIDAESYLYLAGERDAWTLRLGRVGSPAVELAAPAGEFIAYDFAP